MNADRDADPRRAIGEGRICDARGQILAARDDARQARGLRAREDIVEIAREARIGQVRVRIDYAVTLSRRGKSAGPVVMGSPGFSTPHFATSCQRATSGAVAPSSPQIFALMFGVYG